MNAALLALVAIGLYALGYRFYSGFLARRVFQLERDEPVPSIELEDGLDYVPTRLGVLWGHHFTSIAGAAPIVGPALAVIWGWRRPSPNRTAMSWPCRRTRKNKKPS